MREINGCNNYHIIISGKYSAFRQILLTKSYEVAKVCCGPWCSSRVVLAVM